LPPPSRQGEKNTASQPPLKTAARAMSVGVKKRSDRVNRDPNGGLAVGPRRSGLSFELYA